MASEPRVLHLSVNADIVVALRKAAITRESVTVQAGDEVFVIDVVSTDPLEAASKDESDSILNLIGLFESSVPSDITGHKDEYLADAIHPRPR